MAVPFYQEIMLPLLKLVTEQKQCSIREAVQHLADYFKLSEAERNELLPSGTQPTFNNRVHWAKTYLAKAGLLEIPARGIFRITSRGVDALKLNPPRIDDDFLEQYPEFLEFKNRKREHATTPAKKFATDTEKTPEETLEATYQDIRQSLAKELLAAVKKCSPQFFERLVVELLVKMGYGGSRSDAAKAIGRSGDEGIDGIIKEDRLGLDCIYIQAKRWDSVVGRPEIQKFVGALQGMRARKGIFITTSAFTEEAEQYASKIDNKIVLIDGDELGSLMIDHGVGTSTVAIYDLKKIDTDYFIDE